MSLGVPRRIQILSPSYFHVLNRAAHRDRLFDTSGDYMAFLEVLSHAHQEHAIPLLAYCVMPNHFHLVVGPTVTRALSLFMHRLTLTHGKRWHGHRGTRGTGPVYQGRFKAFLIDDDAHFLTVCRYVERNPVEAELVRRAEEWPWSSLSVQRGSRALVLSRWPVPRPSCWLDLVNGE
jgi:putative transposase